MRRINLILLLVLPISSQSFAQKNLRPGFIITNQFDTINGFIDYRGDLLNCSRCVFYTSTKSNPSTFYPGDIHAYRFIGDRFYISRNVKVGQKGKTVFLEYLVDGIANLYYLRDEAGDHYFIEKGNELFELTNENSLIRLNDKKYIKESNFYVGQMKIIYSDMPEILPDVDKTKFERESMMKLSEKYHNLVCNDRSCIIYEKKIRNMILNAGPVISYRWAQYSYPAASSAQFSYLGFLNSFHFDVTQSLYMGLAVNAKFPSINEKLSIRFKSLFGKESNSSSYTETEFSQTTESFLKYEKKRIITSLDIRYEYPKGKIRPTVSIGGEFSFIPDQSSYYNENVYDFNGIMTETNTSNEKIRFTSSGGISGTVGFSKPVGNHNFLFEYYYSYCGGWYEWSRPVMKLWNSDQLWTSARIRESSMGFTISYLF